MGVPHSSVGKEFACSAGDLGSISGVRKIPWRRKWQPTPGFLPGALHEQRGLADHSPWGCKSRTRATHEPHTSHTQARHTSMCRTPSHRLYMNLSKLLVHHPTDIFTDRTVFYNCGNCNVSHFLQGPTATQCQRAGFKHKSECDF